MKKLLAMDISGMQIFRGSSDILVIYKGGADVELLWKRYLNLKDRKLSKERKVI